MPGSANVRMNYTCNSYCNLGKNRGCGWAGAVGHDGIEVRSGRVGRPQKLDRRPRAEPGKTGPDSAHSESTVSETSVRGRRLVRGPEALEKD